jgi:hypothetical protein
MHYFTHLEQTPASIQIFAGLHNASGEAPYLAQGGLARRRGGPPCPSLQGFFLEPGLDNQGRAAISVDP